MAGAAQACKLLQMGASSEAGEGHRQLSSHSPAMLALTSIGVKHKHSQLFQTCLDVHGRVLALHHHQGHRRGSRLQRTEWV